MLGRCYLSTNLHAVYCRCSWPWPRARRVGCDCVFCCLGARMGTKRGTGDGAGDGPHRQPVLLRGVVRMASASVPGMYGWGDQWHLALPGAHGPFPSQRGGRRALFLCGRGAAGMADHSRPRVWTAPFFPLLVRHDIPAKSRFFGRLRLLTRISAPPEQEEAMGYACSSLSGPQGSFPNLTPRQGIRKEERLHAPALSPL